MHLEFQNGSPPGVIRWGRLAEAEASAHPGWKGSFMKGTVTTGRLATRLLSCLAALAAVGMVLIFGATPALADSNPTLTLRLLKSPKGKQGQSVILPGQMSSAGAGYVFRAVKLDRGKVRSFTHSHTGDMQKKLNEAVSADLAGYRDVSGIEYYGASDVNGIIGTRSEQKAQGVWLQDARVNMADGTLTGGVPASFGGTTETPTYWFVSLVAGPKGASARTDSCVIQLPTLTGSDSRGVYNVNVYPKLTVDKRTDPKHVTKHTGLLANTGGSVLPPVFLMLVLMVSGVYMARKSRTA